MLSSGLVREKLVGLVGKLFAGAFAELVKGSIEGLFVE
jgi:hypothetical protein